MDQFESTYHQYYPLLWAVAMKLLADEDTVADVLQDVFEAYFSQSQKSKIRQPKSWLFRVTLNKCADNAAYNKRHTDMSALNMLEDETGNPDSKYDDRKMVQQALSQLPPKERQLAVLYSEGFSYKEMSEIMDIRFSSVGKTLSRVINKLYDILKSSGYETFER
jgi:RNA polymerase sigma-70 factor (ECF subfamily)